MISNFCVLYNLRFFQGTLIAIRDWFRDYKIPDGKPANKFGLGNKAANKVLLPHKSLNTSILRNSIFNFEPYDRVSSLHFL